MNLDLDAISSRTRDLHVDRWPRIIPLEHKKTPADTGFGASRFSSTARSFRVLYAGRDFQTAFAEAIVRDRFVGKQRRYLYRPFLDKLMVTEIGSTSPLRLLDFRGSAAYDLGIDTDTKGARNHTEGQIFSEELHMQTALDGILFDSRLTAQPCLAIYDRAFAKLTGSTPIDLARAPGFANEIVARHIIIRRKRGF